MATSNSTNQESDIVNEVLTTTKHDHVDNFKQFEEIVLKDISVLDLENFDDPSSWIITVEDIFQTLKYKERTFVSLGYDYLHPSLQQWYDNNSSSFQTNWTEFKHQLITLFNQPSSSVKTKHVSFSEQSKHNQEEDSHQQQETELQKQRQEQIQSVVSAIPYFERIGAEAWFSNLLRKFGELDLEPDLIMYYVKEKFIGMPLIWYYENLSKFEDFSSFNPKTFSGRDNVSNWIADIEQKFITAKWPDHLRLEYISQFLTNEAKQWYKEQKNNITTWPQFKIEIKNAYTSTYEVNLAFQRLKNYKQTSSQSIKQYYADIIKLCTDADPQMSEQTKLQHLIANLKPSVKIKIIEKNPKTTSDFLKLAKNIEDLETLISRDPDLNNLDPNNLITTSAPSSHSSSSSNIYITPAQRSDNNKSQQNSIQPQPSNTSSNSSSSQPSLSNNTHSSSSDSTTANSHTNHNQRRNHSFGWTSRGYSQQRNPHFQ
ncbi:unnamed protein product [Didymodactylos carnosus]|uniref:Ty3 transposon capsid-like protein domain-containing protein n=1 Tax=Didymodactylos carnosus TaxID=1234261 RepID=A0A8S2LQL6_9BILA|nr:unnamed protein product [Didymodactylos carnosus]CAF3915385.1 unnamed protein product [Didymodactylos carnosus]